MKYNEAVAHKKESVENAHESIIRDYHIIIVPANTDESQKYIDDFCKDPEAFDDASCKKYCTDDNYEVVSFRKEPEESE
ncbi:hypothetical protein [Chryseobacterium camelliae]|uniref:hypothetical protein n=1 Tax=Chryseobacterium camelliae TaxID=1265445 RepID=UPI000C1C8DD3|nr:hypothetical protein [Chryseobacterium camelliae]MDR6516858.1 hypothetical protein [Chryseobacterium camelliae]